MGGAHRARVGLTREPLASKRARVDSLYANRPQSGVPLLRPQSDLQARMAVPAGGWARTATSALRIARSGQTCRVRVGLGRKRHGTRRLAQAVDEFQRSGTGVEPAKRRLRRRTGL